MNNEDEVVSSFTAQGMDDAQAVNLFNHLCYEVFYANPYGKKLLALLENKYFRSPVASPAREPSWAYFNEGRNELIRSFTHGIQSHLMGEKVKAHDAPVPRRARLKPIRNEG